MNKLEWQLDQLPQVESTSSVASFLANMTQLATEGSPKWYEILINQQFTNNLWNLDK
jgi:hypothetical protein